MYRVKSQTFGDGGQRYNSGDGRVGVDRIDYSLRPPADQQGNTFCPTVLELRESEEHTQSVKAVTVYVNQTIPNRTELNQTTIQLLKDTCTALGATVWSNSNIRTVTSSYYSSHLARFVCE